MVLCKDADALLHVIRPKHLKLFFFFQALNTYRVLIGMPYTVLGQARLLGLSAAPTISG